MVLISLDLSAAFDTVDHAILPQRLQSEFGVTDIPLSWLYSYLEGRTQFVKLRQQQSQVARLDVGVPQGLFWDPCCGLQQPVADVIASHGVQHHHLTDDTQLRFAMAADNMAGGLPILAACMADVSLWYMQNGLQLNPDKSEALIIGTTAQLHAVISAVSSVAVAGVELTSS